MKRLLKGFIVLLMIVYGPLLYLRTTTDIITTDQADPGDAVLVFGALVRKGQISALHAERLDSSIDLLERGTVKTIVVSNAARAAEVMRDYLIDSGVPDSAIEVDSRAPATPDTCVTEMERSAPRSVLLLSQSFHLPRIAFQCANLGLTGQYVGATPTADRSETGILKTLWIRARRHSREALLVWAEILGIYRALS